LLSYATAGQLARLQLELPGISDAKIAQGAGLGATARSAGPALSAALRNGPTTRQLENLDEIIGALASDVDRTGGLCSLALRLSTDRRGRVTSSLTAHIPPRWTGKILKDPPGSDAEVLVQASALLAAFMAADKMDTAGRSITRIRDRYRDELDHLVHRLILISVAPPTTTNYDAQILLGSLASYAFERMRDLLDYQLRYSPMGYRVWRAITKLVKVTTRNDHTGALKSWVRGLVRDSEDLRKRSLYAGRSLDLELAISVPPAWSPPGDDWVHDALLARAREGEATIRERGTAAMGLWERAVRENQPVREETAKELRQLITEFKDPDTRPDAPAGLEWVAVTLEQAIQGGVSVCNEWPDVHQPWFAHVREAANEIDNAGLPDHMRPGTKSLFQHMVLQNAGVHRRQAIETVVTGGWSDPVADALGFLLDKEGDEAWLRVRAEFALSFLQRRDRSVEEYLTRACLHAWNVLRQDWKAADEPPRSHITEMHSSLFAVGDCFGVAGSEESARRVRERLQTVLTELANMKDDRARIMERPARAAAYLLTFTAQPRTGQEKDLSQILLEELAGHPDEVTAGLSRWALHFRFRPDGGIRPLLEAE
jgi:hypothetical protein